jgi:hypothetical protein
LDCIIFGEYKAPPALRNACTKFIRLPIKKNKKSANTEVDTLKDILLDIGANDKYILFAEIGKILKEEYLNYNTKYFDKKRWIKIIKENSQLFDVNIKNSTATVKLK